MVNIGTFLKIADNSGAILGLCINISKFSRHTGVFPGQCLTVDIKKNLFKKHIIKKSLIIIKGKIYKAILVRSLRGIKRWGNFYIRCGKNAIVLLNQYKTPFATRLLGFIYREVRLYMVFRKIISMAECSI